MATNTAKRIGRPREGKTPKKVLNASVKAETQDLLNAWCALLQMTIPATHVGRVLDQLAAFGHKYQFSKTLNKKPLRPSEATGANYPATKS